MKKTSLFLTGMFACFFIKAQIAPHTYWIQFTDKNHNPYSLSRPLEFLSQRSLDRRARQGISLAENDLPVTPAYLDSLKKLGGKILFTSRWQNAATVYSPDSLFLAKASRIPFIEYATRVYMPDPGLHNGGMKANTGSGIQSESSNMLAAQDVITSAEYGQSYNQIHMLNGDLLQNEGYRGQGMIIAQLDAGFGGADTLQAFASVRQRGGILGTHNFLTGTDSVYSQDLHGMWVLSVECGNIPGQLSGSAPDADYYLFHTENGASETQSEEATWTAGMERADSAGADVINCSLGYTTFDDPAMNHTYADMDGHTTICSKEASLVASKGMILCNSAGNDGLTPWHYISAPSDADNILTVGAVNNDSVIQGFSGRGPTFDGRIKPDVCAQGKNTVAATTVDGQVTTVSGTSLSAPIITGLTACLWQGFPDKTSYQVMDAIRRSASTSAHPNDSLGYGLPDYFIARQLLQAGNGHENFIGSIFPNPYRDNFNLSFYTTKAQQADIVLYNITGQVLYSNKIQTPANNFTSVNVQTHNVLSAGVYFLCIKTDTETLVQKVVKQ